jgi:SRSO17 transposase
MLLDKTPIYGSVKDYRPFNLKIVNNTELDQLWNDVIRKYHYLGFGKMVGQSIKYLVFLGERPIAAISYNRPALHVEARDAYIGWTEEGRKKYISNIVCNHRFLIFPWVKVKNLASHILAQSLSMIRSDWKKIHGIEPQLVETFTDIERYKGTCYLAANFKFVGETKGFGKRGHVFEYHGKKKKVLLYELNKGFIKSIAPHFKRAVQPEFPEKPNKRVSAEMLIGMPDFHHQLLKDVGFTAENFPIIQEILANYIDSYKHCFTHASQNPHFVTYFNGLVSNLPRKSVEPIAKNFGTIDKSKQTEEIDPIKQIESKVRSLQEFLKSAPFSDEDLLATYQEILSDTIANDDGMITVDGCDFPKKGKFSVGVARQHCGPLGKTDNCQASVMIGYSGIDGYGLIDRRLYLPKKWMEDDYSDKREKCKIPPDIKFQTKNQIATELLQSVHASNLFRAKWVGADSFFGHDSKFLDAIPKGLYYLADVHADDKFFLIDDEVKTPKNRDGGKIPISEKTSASPLQVRQIVEESKISWQEVEFGIGSKGITKGGEKILRVVDIRNGIPNEEIWLYARKWSDGRVKYMISNAPHDTDPKKLRELSLRRWAIEQCFEECKSNLGMDHYEGRSWKGWHRHILFVFIAHLFLQIIRKKFSAEIHQLSEKGQKIIQDSNIGNNGKVVILTTSIVCVIAEGLFSIDKSKIKKMFDNVSITLKNYAKSFFSFWNKSVEHRSSSKKKLKQKFL